MGDAYIQSRCGHAQVMTAQGMGGEKEIVVLLTDYSCSTGIDESHMGLKIASDFIIRMAKYSCLSWHRSGTQTLELPSGEMGNQELESWSWGLSVQLSKM